MIKHTGLLGSSRNQLKFIQPLLWVHQGCELAPVLFVINKCDAESIEDC